MSWQYKMLCLLPRWTKAWARKSSNIRTAKFTFCLSKVEGFNTFKDYLHVDLTTESHSSWCNYFSALKLTWAMFIGLANPKRIMSQLSNCSFQFSISEGITTGSSLGTFKRHDRCRPFFYEVWSFPANFSFPKMFFAHLKECTSDTNVRKKFIDIWSIEIKDFSVSAERNTPSGSND